MKEAKHKRLHTDFIFGIPRKGKFTETEGRLVAPRGKGKEAIKSNWLMSMRMSWGGENILELDSGDECTTPYKYKKKKSLNCKL